MLTAQDQISIVCPLCHETIQIPIDGQWRGSVITHCSVALVAFPRLNSMGRNTTGVETYALTHPDYSGYSYLGQGMNAFVLTAIDLQLGRRVALKVSKKRIQNDLALHVESARKVASIQHPNIPVIFGIVKFEDPRDHSEVKVVIMQFVEGIPIREIDTKEFLTGVYDPLGILWKIASTLEYCHNKGSFHGDLESLENVLITQDSKVYIIDFGYSRNLNHPHEILFNLKDVDLKALLVLSNHLFGLTIDTTVLPEGGIVGILKTVEMALNSECGRYSFSYSYQKRLEFIMRLGKPIPRFRIIRQRVELTLHADGACNYVYESIIDPFEPLTHIAHHIFFSSPIEFEKLGVKAKLFVEGGEKMVNLVLKDACVDQHEAIFKLHISPVEPMLGEHVFLTSFQHPSAAISESFGFSYDVSAVTSSLEITFKFIDIPFPCKWTIERQHPGEESTVLEDWKGLKLYPETKSATCLFKTLSYPESIHVHYGNC